MSALPGVEPSVDARRGSAGAMPFSYAEQEFEVEDLLSDSEEYSWVNRVNLTESRQKPWYTIPLLNIKPKPVLGVVLG